MYVSKIDIKNFRGIADVSVQFDPRVTVLVGSNNAGKTSVLDALHCVLAHHPSALKATTNDVRVTQAHSDVRSAPAIEIVVRIGPSSGTTFEPGELGRLTPSVDANGDEWIAFRLRCAWDNDPGIRALAATLVRVDATGAQVGEAFGGFPLTAMWLRRFGTVREFDR